jgi:hypothetical protein
MDSSDHEARGGAETDAKLPLCQATRYDSMVQASLLSTDIVAENLHKIFHRWHFAFKQHKARRQLLENKLEENRLTAISAAFGQWRYRVRELELAPMAEDLRQKFDDGLAYAALSTWKRTSKRLPAIEFFGRSLKRQAWQKWREALPEARRMRRAARAGDERMMSE